MGTNKSVKSQLAGEVAARMNISSGGAFEAVFGYSRAVAVGDQVHVSGTCAPAGHEKSDAYTQAKAALAIIEKALGEANASFRDVVRTVVYLRDINDAEDVARAHSESFADVRPASTLVQVSSMMRPWQKVEVEAFASRSALTSATPVASAPPTPTRTVEEALARLRAEAGYRDTYDNFIGGNWRAPVRGQYFENTTPITGRTIGRIARSTAEDIELALDAAHAARESWGRMAPAQRAQILLRLADKMEANLDLLALAETIDNGKPIRETTAADIPLAIDHFRYFASCIRAQEGSLAELDHDTVAYHFHEPLGVVGQIIPWNFPILMAAWKLAPALAAGNCVVLKPAEQTPMSILVLAGLIADLLPAGVLNIVNGFGIEAGKPLAQNKRIAKIAFTGETTTGRLIMQYASENIIPVSLELGGKSPNIFFDDVMAADDDYFDKACEGFAMFALNQGEVCTCPSRALVHERIYDRFMDKVSARVRAIRQGNPLDPQTMIGAQASNDQLEKIMSYVDIGRNEGAKVLVGGGRARLDGELSGGYYFQPTILEGHNRMRVFQEEIFGPVVAVTRFHDDAEALSIANDTLYGLGAGVWSRDGNRAYRFGREIQAGRVWTNCYHLYPAHAAFGGYKQSGIGRENHKMMLDHYQQTKNLLVSYSPKALGFF
jgi:aldehyde dehydrogenase